MSGSRNQSTRLSSVELRVDRRQFSAAFICAHTSSLISSRVAAFHRGPAVEVSRRRPVRDVHRQDAAHLVRCRSGRDRSRARTGPAKSTSAPSSNRGRRRGRRRAGSVLEIELDAVHPFGPQFAQPRERRRRPLQAPASRGSRMISTRHRRDVEVRRHLARACPSRSIGHAAQPLALRGSASGRSRWLRATHAETLGQMLPPRIDPHVVGRPVQQPVEYASRYQNAVEELQQDAPHGRVLLSSARIATSERVIPCPRYLLVVRGPRSRVDEIPERDRLELFQVALLAARRESQQPRHEELRSPRCGMSRSSNSARKRGPEVVQRFGKPARPTSGPLCQPAPAESAWPARGCRRQLAPLSPNGIRRIVSVMCL